MAIARTLRLLLACVALVSTACMLSTTHAAPEVSDLKDVKIKGNGQHYITTDSGQDWVVLGDAASSTRFFLNEATKQIVYTDPRVAPPPEPSAEEEVEGVQRDGDTGAYYVEAEAQEGAVKRWTVHKDTKSGKVFFYDKEKELAQWNDPRKPTVIVQESETFTNLPDQPVTKPSMSAGDKLRMAMIAGVPVALLVIGLGARIYYLHTHYPELLFPTKERRDRRRASGGKFKAQKARGKMSQDGKGGRSANS